MYFYLYETSGYDYTATRVMQHINEFTEEEFSSLIDRIALRFVPEEIAERSIGRKRWYEQMMNEYATVDKTLIPAIIEEAKRPGEVMFESVFDKVADVLIEEFGFSYLKYTAIIERTGGDIIGIVPPVI